MMSLFHLFIVTVLFFHNPSAPESYNENNSIASKKIHSLEESAEYLPWANSRPLTWEDFLCEPKRNTDAVALTSTALGISYNMSNNSLNYEITCSFSKVKSWGILKTPYILAHEQGHFDITEIYARKLHKELQDYKFNRKTFRQDVNVIYDRVVKEKENLQFAYDGLTDHSRNKTVQAEWLEKIQELLIQTEAYADYP